MPAAQILVVDDHQLLRQGLRSLLEDNGLEVVGEASNGSEAVEAARRTRPDIVLMDLTMPEVNGIEATRQILVALPNAKVIAISARADATVVRDALAAGATAFVPKEAAFEEIGLALAAVRRGNTYISPRVAGGLVGAMVRGDGHAGGGGSRPLTPREREVLQLTAEGLAMKQVASQLGVSVKTIETHRRQIMDKLDLHSVAELTKYAIRHGMTPE